MSTIDHTHRPAHLAGASVLSAIVFAAAFVATYATTAPRGRKADRLRVDGPYRS